MKGKLVLAGALAAALVAASAAGARVADMKRVGAVPTKEPGKLIVGFDLPAPGFVQGTAVGDSIRNPRGFEVDMVKLIAKQLGNLEVEWKRTPFTGLFKPGPKDFDFATEEATITAAREKVVDFSRPYYFTNQAVLVRKGLSPLPKRLRDLKSLQLCSQATTTGLDYIKTKLRPSKAPLVYQSLANAFKAVEVGQCDAIVMDLSLVVSERRTHPGKYGPVVGQIVTNEGYGAIFESGNPLRASVNAAIKKLKANGTLDRLARKWTPYVATKILR